jgi:hypothetical protein
MYILQCNTEYHILFCFIILQEEGKTQETSL